MATHSAPVMNPEAKKSSRIKIVLEMIKFEHSVFALPFALTGALLGARATHRGWPTLRQLAWVIVAMVAARSAAMTVNRIVDLRYDRENPRTKQRALATGLLSVPFAWTFTLIAVAIFFLAAWQLNLLALKLAPLALAILFFYSFTKRFTTWSHLFLGFALGISPAAAWIAITGGFDPRMLILCAAVTLWVGGFDVLYACQDLDYDRRAGAFFRSTTLWSRECAGDCARDARRGGDFAGRAGGKFRAAVAGVGRHCGGGGAAGLRTFAGESRRPEQAGRCVFRNERLY